MKYYEQTIRSRALLFFAVALFTGMSAQGQDNSVLSVARNKVDQTPTSITFAAGANIREDQAQELFRKYLGVDGVNTTMVLKYSTTTKSNVTAKRYEQFYKGIKIDYSGYSLTSKNGIVTFMTGNYYKIDKPMSETPAMTESTAFSKALAFVGADKYMWEDPLEERRIKDMYNREDTTFKPRGVLKWVEDFRGRKGTRELHLAWVFNIYAQAPLSRQEVYVDASTGKVLYSNSLIKHTAATGKSRYSGVVNFVTSKVGATYRLFDSTRGNGVHTLNMNNGSSYGAATQYNSATNTWPLAVPDTIALDAHWGAEKVYDYWKLVQGRLSYDDADSRLLQYVHYQSGYNNAFWNGSEMTYGDGSGCSSGFTPLVSLDVTGHEIGHGVCEYTANLVYELESGAMNESFSDCWGATIEAWADPLEGDAVPKSVWKIGEEIKCGTPLRRMDFPKLAGDPDCYGGINWFNVVACIPGSGNDNCGVHTNSGVMNKWYYLVVNGGAATNDLGDAYSVTGIGFGEAANILYQTELVLSSTADYALMRISSINIATTLYGACSPEVVTVTNAWYAVGVGPAYVAFPAFITGPSSVCVGNTITLADASSGGAWSSSFPSIATVSSGGVVTGISPGVDTIIYSVGSGCDAKKLVTVNTIPVATINPAPTATLCTGGTALLTATSGGGYTYQWKLGGVDIPGATNMTYNAPVTGNYTVEISAGPSCTSLSSITTAVAATPPTATITPASTTTFCDGGSVVLNANTGIGLSYQWQSGGSPIAGATTANYTATVGANYTVVVTNLAGCSTTSAITTVVVNPLPPAITGTTTLCVGLTTTLSNTSPGGTWSSSNPAVGTVAGGLVMGTGAGTANITYTLGTGCFITEPITVNPFPTAITGATNVCIGSTTALADAVPGGSWSSSSAGVAFVDVAGIVTGVTAGTATISYTLGAGCYVVANVTVNPLPAVIGGVANVCVGGTTSLSNATPGGTWSSGLTGVATVVPGSGLVTGVSAGTAPISYTLTTGCSSVITVTVNSVTVAPITGLPAVCVGATTALSSTTTGGVWASSNTAVAIVNTFGSVIGIASGVVTISYTITNPCGSATVTTPVTVNALPTVAPITGTTTICSGTGTTLADATLGGVWSSSNPLIATVSSTGFVSALSLGTANINYTYTNSLGCSAVATTVFTVFSPFSAVITPGGPTNFCLGGSVALSTTAGSGLTYQWKKNGVNIPGAISSIYTASTTGNYTVQVTSSTGCNTISAPIAVTVDPTPVVAPVVSISATPGPIFCLATSLATFTATAFHGGSAPLYQWSVNGVVSGAGPSFTYTPTAGDVVSVVLTSNATCAFPLTATNSATISVSALQTPAVSISSSSALVCSGDMATYTAVPVFGGTSPTYVWNLNGVNVGTGGSYTYAPSNGDVLICNMISNYPCVVTPLAISSTYTVHVQPMIPNVINVYASFTSLAPGVVDTFVAVAPYAGSTPTYQWRINGAPVPGATNSIFITSSLTNGMEISCQVTSSNPCVHPGTLLSSGVIVTVWGVGVQQVAANGAQFSLLPNPNKGAFTISGSLGTASDDEVNIVITNVLGQTIYTETAKAQNGIVNAKINLGKSIANGTYLVRVTSGNGNAVFHMVLDK